MLALRRSGTRHLLLLTLSLAVYAMSAMAQLVDTGTIAGTVYDPSHAAVPGCAVTVTNEATNIPQTTTTDSKGEYVVPSLKVGTYTLKVEKTGFETLIQKGIIVDVQARVQVDVMMQLGATTQQVEVTAVSPLLHSQTAEVGEVTGSKVMEDLPLNGRDYSSLALLTAGVYIGTGVSAPGWGYFNINGNNDYQNNFILDGADNNNFIENAQGGSSEPGHPPVDALAEFKVQTRTYDAEFGRAAGGVINAQIKSGTNQLHGDIWEFLRNNDLDANDFFLNRAGAPRSEYRQNQFGGTAGGPIVRNKAFVFGAYEGTRVRQGLTLLGTVPTPLMRQYNFTELPVLPTSPTIPGLAQDAGCITNGVLKASCVDSTAAKIYPLYPLPDTNTAAEGVAGGFTGNNFISSSAQLNNVDNGVLRADQKIGEKNSLFEHYTISDEHITFPSLFSASSPIADGNINYQLEDTTQRRQNAATGLTHIFSPTLLLDLRAGWNRMYHHADQFAVGNNVYSQYGINGVPVVPGITGGLPEITPAGFTVLGSTRWQPMIEVSYIWDFRGALTEIKGSHTIKMGLEGLRNGFNYLDNCCTRGFYNFSGQYTGQGVTDMLLGAPNDVELTNVTIAHKYIDGMNPFVQDTWRATSKLTLDYGLRWEYASPFIERNNRLSNFNPAQGLMYTPTSGGPRSLYNPYYGGWGPRIGLAYRIQDKLVFRGGYGIYYENYDRRGNMSDLALNPPFFIDHAAGAAATQPPPFQWSTGFAANWLAPPDITNPAALGPLYLRAVDPKLRSGMIQQASGGFEYAVAPNLLLSTYYVGNYGHRLWRGVNINQKILTTPGQPSADVPYPEYLQTPGVPALDNLPTTIQQLQSDGNSNYQALEASVEKRFSHGLSFLASYVYSKNLVDFTHELTNVLGHADMPQDSHNLRGNKGLADVDAPQRLVLSYSYALPVGRGTRFLSSGVPGKLLEMWQINGIATFQSGQPYELNAPFDASFTGISSGGGEAERPNCIKTPAKISRTVDTDFDTSAFAVPANYTFGTCGVTPGVRDRGIADYDMSFFKEFPFTENKRMEFRAEFFNLVNHTNFGPAGYTVGVPGFGAITSEAIAPRQIQFALKFFF